MLSKYHKQKCHSFLSLFYCLPQAPSPGVPQIPELLRDIMNLEPLLSDDDIPADFIMDGPFVEQALYSYMMQLAELRLYKLVRWARNLPQFGAISVSLGLHYFDIDSA